MKKIYKYLIISIILLFTACGEEQGSSSNNTPIITSIVFNIDEGQTSIGTIQANDSDNDTLSLSIDGGDDASLFTLNSSGTLSFKQAPSYSSPSDNDTNNEYSIVVKVSDFKDSSTKTISIRVRKLVHNEQTIIQKLNTLRKNSGMISLKDNAILKLSALNHANYLVDKNISSHEETNNSIYFTGEKPVHRALAAGYKSRKVSENLSKGQASEDLSLDGLMGAIYHRFGFLAFDINEIGYDKNDTTYVYNMGNSNIQALCNDNNFTSSGIYYHSVCQDKSFRIQASVYDNAINKVINANPKYVIYPYINQTDITPVFYEESPDPLPNHNVSGYPISIEFNKNDFNMSKLTVHSFTLKDQDSNTIDLIDYNDSTSIMTKKNNIHGDYFNEYQFIIFPEKRLDFNTTYSVLFDYTYDGNNEKIKWNFTTKKIDNLIKYNDTNLTLQLNIDYNIYFEPINETDTINTYSIAYTHTSGTTPIITHSSYDNNTIKLKFTGTGLQTVTLTLNGNAMTNKTIGITINE
jgi:uncharacterized protein YkwD